MFFDNSGKCRLYCLCVCSHAPENGTFHESFDHKNYIHSPVILNALFFCVYGELVFNLLFGAHFTHELNVFMNSTIVL